MGIIPTDWRRGVVVPIRNEKGDTQECNNYKASYPPLHQAKSWHEFFSNRRKLLNHQRHEQSDFTHKKSTVGRILAFIVLTERLRDLRSGLLAAYMDQQGVRLGELRCTLENPGPP